MLGPFLRWATSELREQLKWTANLAQTGICPTNLFSSPDLSGNESLRGWYCLTLAFMGLTLYFKKKKKRAFNIKCYSNSLKCSFQCHCGAHINSNKLTWELITLIRTALQLQGPIFRLIQGIPFSAKCFSLPHDMPFAAMVYCYRGMAESKPHARGEMKKLFLCTVQEKPI